LRRILQIEDSLGTLWRSEGRLGNEAPLSQCLVTRRGLNPCAMSQIPKLLSKLEVESYQLTFANADDIDFLEIGERLQDGVDSIM
jgi:hypothetical protein